MCQYNNIYTSLYKYLKGKKKKTNKQIVATIAIVPLGTVVTIQNLGKKKRLTKPKYCSYSALAHSCTSIIVKILWNLLCQYNNIYTGLHKYLKEKKKAQTDYRKKKKKNYSYCSYSATWHCSYCSKLGGKKSGSRNQSTIATVI